MVQTPQQSYNFFIRFSYVQLFWVLVGNLAPPDKTVDPEERRYVRYYQARPTNSAARDKIDPVKMLALKFFFFETNNHKLPFSNLKAPLLKKHCRIVCSVCTVS